MLIIIIIIIIGKKEKHKEEESKRKLGETISLNIGTPDCPNNVKIGAQCIDEEKLNFTELLREFQDFFIHEDNKIPKGLTPLESSFSSSDVGDKEKHKEEESKRKVGETFP
jgi:hypothetical protein